MSVINKMLKDLDQRQQSGDNNVYVPGKETHSKVLLISLSCLVLILVVALVVGFWYFSSKNANSSVSEQLVVASSEQSASNKVDVKIDDGIESVVTIEDIAAKEKSDNELLSDMDKEQDIAALEDEIYGPDNVVDPKKLKSEKITVTPDPVDVVTVDEKPKVMTIKPVTLTLEQEIELDKKAAGMALSQGNIAQAKENFQSILAKDPRNVAAREKLASLAYGEGNWIQAQTILQQGISLQPTYANYRLLMARILMEQNRNKDALTVLTGFSPKASSENLDYLATEATLATDLNESLIAIEAYSKLTRIMPKEGKWWLGLAISFDRQGTVAAARANYKQALTIGVPTASRKFAQERLAELEGK